jgi:DNA-binding NtrC family response regulator
MPDPTHSAAVMTPVESQVPDIPNERDSRSLEATATILVVDDEPSIVTLCQIILMDAGFTVLGAHGSPDALAICTKYPKPINLLLADLILPPPCLQVTSGPTSFPHLNGYQLAVRAATIRHGMRMILMSGNPDKELESHGITRGSLPFLAKPFEKDRLVDLIRAVLAQPIPKLKRRKPNRAGIDIEWFG